MSLVIFGTKEKEKGMLTELPFPKGLTGSSGNSKASITIKGNFREEWSRRRGLQQLQDFLKTFWGEAGDLAKCEEQTTSKKRPRMLCNFKELWNTARKTEKICITQGLPQKYLTRRKGSKRDKQASNDNGSLKREILTV